MTHFNKFRALHCARTNFVHRVHHLVIFQDNETLAGQRSRNFADKSLGARGLFARLRISFGYKMLEIDFAE